VVAAVPPAVPPITTDSTNIKKLIRALVTPFQDLEDTMQQMLTERTVDTAIGAQLDAVGKMVGCARGGLDDDTYRRHIRAQIMTNKSDGLIEEMLVIASLIVYDDAATYVLDNQGVAAFMLRIDGLAISMDLAKVVISFLRRAVAGGVRVILETQDHSDDDAFTLDSFVPDTGPGKGFLDFVEADGGKLGSALE
jgi:hypothetical protein